MAASESGAAENGGRKRTWSEAEEVDGVDDGLSNPELKGLPRFLAKVATMLETPEYAPLVSWRADGRAFRVHKPTLFARQVLPRYFKHHNFGCVRRRAATARDPCSPFARARAQARAGGAASSPRGAAPSCGS